MIKPFNEDIEAYEEENPIIQKGSIGEVNMILPNGRYHILIKNKEGEKIAYVVADEEVLEEVSSKKKVDEEDIENVQEELVDAHHNKIK
jgi:heat shock protein HspQ